MDRTDDSSDPARRASKGGEAPCGCNESLMLFECHKRARPVPSVVVTRSRKSSGIDDPDCNKILSVWANTRLEAEHAFFRAIALARRCGKDVDDILCPTFLAAIQGGDDGAVDPDWTASAAMAPEPKAFAAESHSAVLTAGKAARPPSKTLE